MRVPQPKGTHGSLRWIQEAVNEYPEQLNSAIYEDLGYQDKITWVSPLEEDDYAEYRDDGFLDTRKLDTARRRRHRHHICTRRPRDEEGGPIKRSRKTAAASRWYVRPTYTGCGNLASTDEDTTRYW